MKLSQLKYTSIGAAVGNMAMAYAVFMLTRIVFFLVNWSTFAPHMSWSLAGHMLQGALVFDTSALLYINALYLVLMLFPLWVKETATFHRVLKWLFVVTNLVGVASNLIDSVYVQYTGRRSTVTVFSEFANENNISSIIMGELATHWYLLLVFMFCVLLLWEGYVMPYRHVWKRGWHYYATQVACLVVLTPLAIIGIRGSATAGTRPITISNANQYVNRPIEGTVVLNTPFSMIRSIGKKPFVTPHYMSEAEMKKTYVPIITPKPDEHTLGKKNVVILIVESMGKEYIGAFNRELEGGNYKGYMPFIDSLVPKSLTFKYSYANGRISMDAMPSVLSGIPMMVEPFFLTPASFNDVSGVPRMLEAMGYCSAFFHGGHNISMGFSAFAHTIGFQRYFGLNEYCRSPKYHGMDDFDGKWAIWDEPFFQYMLDEIEHLKQPFVVGAFSASSHHPYKVPQRYEDVYKEEGKLPIYRCVRYTDMALRRFFERASRQSWYNNTIFVLVADHTNLNEHAPYKTDLGLYSIPIMFYTPDGSLKPAMRDDVIAQQTDVMPTLMHLLGYDKPYVAFGSDLLGTPAEQTWAFNYNNGIYQYLKGDYMLQFDGNKTIGFYRFKTDVMLKQNLVNEHLPQQQHMEHEIKALIQQYMMRMNTNNLVIR